MDASIYMKGDYEEFNALGRRKNKANSKPKLSQSYGKAKVKRQKAKMRVSPEFLRRGYLKKQSQL